MSVHLKTSHYIFEIGSSDLLISFFDTIEVRLTKGIFKKKYPTILGDLYQGKLSVDNIDKAEKELIQIRKRLQNIKPSKVIWDKNDIDKQPPWGQNISNDITDLSNYHVTPDGKVLFDIIFSALKTAKEEKCDLIIE